MKNLEQSSSKSAYLHVIKLLSKKDYSRSKLEAKLIAKEFEPDDIQNAIEIVIEKGFLKEEDYATARAKVLMEKGIHPDYILIKLSEESLKFSAEQLSNLFDEYAISISSQINTLISKKIRTMNFNIEKDLRIKAENKVIRYVLTKGHDPEEVKPMLQRLIQNKTN